VGREREALRLKVERLANAARRADEERDESTSALEAAGLTCGDVGPGGVRCQRPKRVPHGHGQHRNAKGGQRREW
jgi:hypothetical protein